MKIYVFLIVLITSCFPGELVEMQKACDRKMPTACYEFGILYEEGLGVDKNISKSIDYYRKACDYGYDKACQNLEKLETESTQK